MTSATVPTTARACVLLLVLAAAPAAQQVLRVTYGPQTGGDLGATLAAVGDLDGDGVQELAVGAPLEGDDAGRVRLLDGASLDTLWQVDGGADGGWFGHAVAGAGDVNGDGVPDVLVGAPHAVSGQAGVARVLSGSNGVVLRTITGTAANDYLGFAVAGPGDLDLDGFADVALGVPNAPGVAPSNAGRVRVVRGGAAGNLWVFDGDVANQRLGGALAALGDVDGDGLPDLLVGPRDTFFLPQGDARVISGVDGSQLMQLGSADAGDLTGTRLAGPGDLDRDGVPDLAVGAPRADVGGTNTGSVRAYGGADGGLLFAVHGASGSHDLDGGLAGAGDVDGDGWLDLALGSVGTFPAGGQLRAVSGRDGGELYVLASDEVGERLGESAAALGDVNGDGLDEVAAGMPGARFGRGGVRAVSPRLPVAPLLELPGVGADEVSGSRLATGEDFDGDGLGDWVVGVPRVLDAGGTVWAGALRVHSSAGGALIHQLELDAADVAAGATLGEFFDVISDVDGDAVPDLVLGFPEYAGGGLLRFVSGADLATIRETPAWAPVALGNDVARAGDVDGDGVEDVIAGAVGDDTFGDGGGAAIVSGATGAVLRVVGGPDYFYALFGEAVAGAGDVDADGHNDVVVGARFDNLGNGSQGSLWVFDGSGALLQQVYGSASLDYLGTTVAGPGDLDLDGFDDVVGGAPGYDGNSISTNQDGALRAWSGADGSLLWEASGVTAESGFGNRLAVLGDQDGDGVRELLTGMPGSSGFGPYVGALSVVSGASGARLLTLSGPQGTTGDDEQFGAAVAAAGDVDGDGFDDLLVGLPGADASVDDEGLVQVLSGRPVSWVGRGQALAGSWGTPSFQVQGDLLPGADTTWRLGGARELSTAYLVVGVTELLAPFKGGMLLPSPDLVVALPTDADGALAFPLVWSGVPAGLVLHVQHWVVDPAGPLGFAASNALSGTTY